VEPWIAASHCALYTDDRNNSRPSIRGAAVHNGLQVINILRFAQDNMLPSDWVTMRWIAASYCAQRNNVHPTFAVHNKKFFDKKTKFADLRNKKTSN